MKVSVDVEKGVATGQCTCRRRRSSSSKKTTGVAVLVNDTLTAECTTPSGKPRRRARPSPIHLEEAWPGFRAAW